MKHGNFTPPLPVNEPIKSYAPGSPEKGELKRRLESMRNENVEIPLVIGGKEVRTGKTENCVEPHDHHHVLGKYHKGGPREIETAVAAANEAWKSWSETPFEARAAVFLKAAELPRRTVARELNARRCRSEQDGLPAEIDAACELVDFGASTSTSSTRSAERRSRARRCGTAPEYRPPGFVVAITPFNFTSTPATS
jgi:1-pyrroline-5-carboxylate dehydrogenase